MDDPLNRRMIIALLALLPTFLFALACQAFSPPVPSHRDSIAAELAALPGGPAEAPLLAGAMVPQTMSADAMEQARTRNLADPFFTGLITPAAPFKLAGSITDRGNARDCLALAAMAPPRAVTPLVTGFAVGQGLAAALFFTWRPLF